MTSHPSGTHTEPPTASSPEGQGNQPRPSVSLTQLIRPVLIALAVLILMIGIGGFVPDTAYGHWTEPGRDFLLNIYSAGGPPPHFV